MESITLIEHEVLKVVAVRKQGERSLSKEQATTLEKLESHFPPGTFTWGHSSVKFAQYCGVISMGNLSLEILPKIYGKEEDPGASRKALVKMLVRAKRLKVQRGGVGDIALQKHTILDVFILLFCEQLHAELLQGMIRHYVVRNENLNVVRGRLKVEQQFKYNLVHKERLFCQHDELSEDTFHNQIIKYALSVLVKRTTTVLVRKKLTELLMRFDGVSDTRCDPIMIDSLIYNRTTNRYRPILEQCRWFIQGFHPDVLIGNSPCMTLLFDMNRLFESFVGGVFRRLAWLN